MGLDEIRTRQSTAPLVATPPPPPPPPPPPAPVAGPTVAADQSTVAGNNKRGTSLLSLPGTMPAVLQQTANDLMGPAKDIGVAATTANQATTIIKTAASAAKGTLTTVSTAANEVKLLGGAGGVLGLATNSIKTTQGVNELLAGDTRKGLVDVASGGVGLVSNVGSTATGLQAASALTKVGEASTLIKGAGVVGETLGKFTPGLTIAAGAIQTVGALTTHPPDYKVAACGTATAVGGALMFFPPVGTAVGATIVAGAAIVQNWDAISAGAGHLATGAAHLAGDVANVAVDAARSVEHKVEGVVDTGKKALSAVGDFLGI
jgi:hypothetical protein